MSSAKFIKSAYLPTDFPPDVGIEIGIVGRSNAGKSSLVNVLTNHRIAHVSNTPGKTRLLNFFEINGKYTLVDMPGYGYASRSNDEVRDWRRVIENYLVTRQSLAGLLLVMDSRRDWASEEESIKAFCENEGVPLAIVATKVDKLSRQEKIKMEFRLIQQSRLHDVFSVSAIKKTGHVELEEWVFRNWVMPHLGGAK